MAGILNLLSLIERKELRRFGVEHLLGLLSLYTLLNIVEYMQMNSRQEAQAGPKAQAPTQTLPLKITEPSLQRALTAVLGNSSEKTASNLVSIAESLGKNPAILMNLANLLAEEGTTGKTEK